MKQLLLENIEQGVNRFQETAQVIAAERTRLFILLRNEEFKGSDWLRFEN